MLSDCKSMLDGHLSRTIIGFHRIKIFIADANLVNPVSYQAGGKLCDFERNVINIIMSEGVMKPAKTK